MKWLFLGNGVGLLIVTVMMVLTQDTIRDFFLFLQLSLLLLGIAAILFKMDER